MVSFQKVIPVDERFDRLNTALNNARNSQDAFSFYNLANQLGIDLRLLPEPDKGLYEQGQADYQNFSAKQVELQRLEDRFSQESQQGPLESIADKSNSPQLKPQLPSETREEQDPTDLGLSKPVDLDDKNKGMSLREAYASHINPKTNRRNNLYFYSSPEEFYQRCVKESFNPITPNGKAVFRIGELLSNQPFNPNRRIALVFLADCIVNDVSPEKDLYSDVALKKEVLIRAGYLSLGSSFPAWKIENIFKTHYNQVVKIVSPQKRSA